MPSAALRMALAAMVVSRGWIVARFEPISPVHGRPSDAVEFPDEPQSRAMLSAGLPAVTMEKLCKRKKQKGLRIEMRNRLLCWLRFFMIRALN